MCDALRGRCAAEEFMKDKPTAGQVFDRVADLAADDETSDVYYDAFVSVVNNAA